MTSGESTTPSEPIMELTIRSSGNVASFLQMTTTRFKYDVGGAVKFLVSSAGATETQTLVLSA